MTCRFEPTAASRMARLAVYRMANRYGHMLPQLRFARSGGKGARHDWGVRASVVPDVQICW